MRLVITLQALNNYKCLPNERHIEGLHKFFSSLDINKYCNNKYKDFVYTDLIPFTTEIYKNTIKKLVFSTNNVELYLYVKQYLCNLTHQEIIVNNGIYKVISIEDLNININIGDKIYSVSPIVLKENNNYWGSKYHTDNTLQSFIEYLNRNSNLKLNCNDFNILDCFSNMKYKKTCVLRYKNSVIVGSLWDFIIKKDISVTNLNKLNILFQMGFGSKTGLGFGFINKVK